MMKWVPFIEAYFAINKYSSYKARKCLILQLSSPISFLMEVVVLHTTDSCIPLVTSDGTRACLLDKASLSAKAQADRAPSMSKWNYDMGMYKGTTAWRNNLAG